MSTIRDRAIKLYAIAHSKPEADAINYLEDMLRVTRHEGINRGVDLAEKYSHRIERKSA